MSTCWRKSFSYSSLRESFVNVHLFLSTLLPILEDGTCIYLYLLLIIAHFYSARSLLSTYMVINFYSFLSFSPIFMKFSASFRCY